MGISENSEKCKTKETPKTEETGAGGVIWKINNNYDGVEFFFFLFLFSLCTSYEDFYAKFVFVVVFVIVDGVKRGGGGDG